MSQVVEERDGAGALVARNHYGLNPVSSLRAGAERFYVGDGVGSIRLLTDAAGAPIADHAYDAYGNTLQTTGTADDPYRYGGQQLDAETGLYYMRQRYYDPVAGRFLGMDPVAGDPLRPLTLNRYAYALNDPVNLADPTGEFFTLIGVSLAGLQDGAGNAVELTTKTQQLCRFKAVACAAGLVQQLRSFTAENLTLLNTFTTSVTTPTFIGQGGASIRPDLKLLTYEDPRETASPAALKQFSIVAKFPAVGALDLEIKGQRFGGGLSFGITPQWGGGNFTYQGVQGSLEQEFQLYVFDPCTVPMGSIGLGIATQAGYARGQGMMGTSASVEIALKLDVPFLPAIDFPVLKVPWW
jgi:RHS repeat-associated protein